MPQRKRQLRWAYVYFLLAAFDLATVSVSLYLNHSILGTYSDSVEVNAQWAERQGSLGDLMSLAVELNAPGNDIFESGDIQAESRRFQAARVRFSDALDEVEQSLAGINGEQDFLTQVAETRLAMNRQATEAEAIFERFGDGDRTGAAQRMAAMDQQYSVATRVIHDMSDRVSEMQSVELESQLSSAVAMRRWEYFIAAAVMLMVIGVTFYGHKMAKIARRHEQEREEQERRIRVSEERYALAMAGSRDGLWDWDLVRNRIFYADRWRELLGCMDSDIGDSPDAWFGRITSSSLKDFHKAIERHVNGESNVLDIELEMRHGDGSTRWMLCRAAALRDKAGKAVRLTGSMADITELKNSQEQLRLMAQTDRLTGLPNRALMTDLIDREIARCTRDANRQFAVLFFDFDRFKVINDGLGHSVGDALLQSVADRFRNFTRDGVTAARFGGDEFVMLVEAASSEEQCAGLCKELLHAFARSHEIEGHEVVSTASIGLVIGDAEYDSADDVLADADAAMYQAKSDGRGAYRVFDAEMRNAARQRLDLENEMRRGIFAGEFELYYQPILCLQTGQLTGFEALARWIHPEHGFIAPDRFIPIAEETGLIVDLGDRMLRDVCHQLAQWQRMMPMSSDLTVNVNLSKRQLAWPGLLEAVEGAIADAGIQSSCIKLEITESAIMDDRHDMVPILERIRAMGIQLAMDDFGTGHSSLSCLHRFPINVLKIDRSFVDNLERQRHFSAVVNSVVSLAHHLGMEVVAEGISSKEQLAQLQAMDCQFGQGYLFAKPMSVSDATTFIEDRCGVSEAA